jgi:DNA helicase II / ATP-dependent DNA helicase PcrA
LEFKNVFVVGLEEELFPSSMALSEVKGVEEERRLFYVALTRAEDFCMLTYARSRFRNGQTESSNPSRFLKEIGEEFLDVQDGMLSRSFSLGNERRESSFSGLRASEPRRSSFSEERNKRESPFQKAQTVQPTLPRSNFVKAENARPKAGSNDGADDVKPGDVIAHERFGMGTIVDVSGDANSRKATVEFENAGTKQLLLKFAKYKKVK